MDRTQSTSLAAAQCASAVMMVRPAAFGWNQETASSNRFQAAAPLDAQPVAHAIAEFDRLAAALVAAGVAVHVLEDRAELRCPDAVFPNNWVSLHADGTIVLYPMLAPNRRRERRPDVLAELLERGAFRAARRVDLSHHEGRHRYLEGTGSVVFDHVHRVAYACRSPRTDATVLDELCRELAYEPHLFDASGPDGAPVYHTNVMLAVGRGHALVCTAAVAPADRGALLERLSATGREVLSITRREMAAFAGNTLELTNASGEGVLAASQCAFDALAPQTRERLAAQVRHRVSVPIPTIERLGGGSVRCMLAEVFLPRATDPAGARPG
jgi:hypothetical protein